MISRSCVRPSRAITKSARSASGWKPKLSDPELVDEGSMSAGVALARWFGHEARRVYSMLGESDEDRDHRRLVELIERRGGSTSVRDWQRSRSHETSADAEAELKTLESAGYGTLRPAPQTGRGRPSKVFTLHRSHD